MFKVFKRIFIILLVIFFGCQSKIDKNKMSNKDNNIFETMVKTPVKLHYSLYIPDDYYDNDSDYPLVLYLHGKGERGEDLKKIEVNGLPEVISKGKTFPFLTLAPQCPEFGWWSRSEYVEALADLLNEVVKERRVNTKKIYATGLSMGGYGTLALAKKYPDLFAAIIPICGGMDDHDGIKRLKDMPIWLFHGDLDETHPVERSTTIYDLLSPINKNIKLTIYECVGHNSWDETYANDEIYDWLLSYSKD